MITLLIEEHDQILTILHTGRGVSQGPEKWLCNSWTAPKLKAKGIGKKMPGPGPLLSHFGQNSYLKHSLNEPEIIFYKSVSSIAHPQICFLINLHFVPNACMLSKFPCLQGPRSFLAFCGFFPVAPSPFLLPESQWPSASSLELGKTLVFSWFKVEFGIIFLLCGRFQLKGGCCC